jgi:hypothetical protein
MLTWEQPFEEMMSVQVRGRELQAGCGISFLAGHGLKFCPSCGRTWGPGFPARTKNRK